MHSITPHPWPTVPAEAIALQKELRDLVIAADDLGEVSTVAGLDVGPQTNAGMIRGAVAALSFPDLRTADQAVAYRAPPLPYVPGLLSFREVPALLAALQKLCVRPELLLCDGQGLAHPRRFGIACHLGVLTGIPSIGVAKSLLVGEHAPVPAKRGAWRPLLHKGEVVGRGVTHARGQGARVCLHRPSREFGNRYSVHAGVRATLPIAGNHARRAPARLRAVTLSEGSPWQL